MSARKAAGSRGDWAEYNPQPQFPHATASPVGTYMFSDPMKVMSTNTRLRELLPSGITRVEGRSVGTQEPFFATGEARVARNGKLILVRIIPADGYPGWLELQTPRTYDPGAGDVISDTFAAWFTPSEEIV